jgi:hypothetical protein
MRYSSIIHTPHTQQRKFYLFITAGTSVVWLWIFYTLYAGMAQGFSPCIFRGITGISCPSCGITRGIVALLQGNISAPAHYNMLAYIAMPVLVIAPLWLIVDSISAKASMYTTYTHALHISKQRPAILISFFALIAANWIWTLYNNI